MIAFKLCAAVALVALVSLMWPRRARMPDITPGQYIAQVILCLALYVGVIVVLMTSPARAAALRIPPASVQYRFALERSAGRYFGLDAPVATLAAQIQQESGWNPRAQSPYAQGLTQFTPATAKWLPGICPELGAPDPWDPDWALGAIACYDAWLRSRVGAVGKGAPDNCTRWAFALRAYNGGEGALARERRLAKADGADANAWRVVARYSARASWAHRENVDYPVRILIRIEPIYRAAGWPGKAACT